ncbi:MAG: transcriptional regulator [Pseudomonadota bacterium]|jgi:hypothetical protein
MMPGAEPAPAPEPRAPSHKLRLVACLECGAEFHPGRAGGEFCCTPCRKAFNNRRMTRGALLYDLLMALRFERKEARLLGVWQALCRLASDFREEDKRERDSRRSWRRAKTVLGERPHLRATTFKVRAGK